MFTGLVEQLGVLVAISGGAVTELEIEAPIAAELSRGDSIAVNGVCLTVRGTDGARFRVDTVDETLRRTTLGALEVGARVNLEPAMLASGRLGGHFVLGHVDGVATVTRVAQSGEIDVVIGEGLARYVVEKGSVALDGVSLTVARLDRDTITIALIPETREATTLGAVAVGSRLNVEVDILAKHLERLAASR